MTFATISFATEEEVRSGVLGRRLREFNYGFVGEYPETKPVWLNAKDAEGNLVGGLRAVIALHWLRVEVLWVEESARGNGLGARLLRQAEKLAKEMGAEHSGLETFEWQAPGFYLKQGYQEAARVDNYAKGFYLAFMTKKL
jgi:GNAT superfamily N-acetyltransferase